MSKATLNYAEIENARKDGKKSSNELEDYTESIHKQVILKLNDLPGEDSSGYISTAISAAYQKCEELSGIQEDFFSLDNQLTNLVTFAKAADKKVKNEVKTIAEENLEEESLWEKIGSSLYDLFCVDIPNILSQFEFFDVVIDGMRKLENWIEHSWENITEWFNSGWGIYVKNIVGAVKDFLKASVFVGAVVYSAFTAFVAAPIGAAVAAVAVVAGGIYVIYKFINMTSAINNNGKAIEYYKKAENTKDLEEKSVYLGYANYYGRTDDFSDYVKKTDYGGKDLNDAMGELSDGIDVMGKSSEGILHIINFTASWYKMGAIYDDVKSDNPKITGYDFKLANMKNNLTREIAKRFEIFGYEDGNFSMGKYFGEQIGWDSTWEKTTVGVIGTIDDIISKPTNEIGNVWNRVKDKVEDLFKYTPIGAGKSGVDTVIAWNES